LSRLAVHPCREAEETARDTMYGLSGMVMLAGGTGVASEAWKTRKSSTGLDRGWDAAAAGHDFRSSPWYRGRMLSSTMPLCFFLGALLYLFPKAGAWVLAVWFAVLLLQRWQR